MSTIKPGEEEVFILGRDMNSMARRFACGIEWIQAGYRVDQSW